MANAEAEADLPVDTVNKIINEVHFSLSVIYGVAQVALHYKIWKKNSAFLYDLVITHALEWPTLTVQWMPDMESPPDADHTVQRLLIGTHTSDSDRNFLQIATVNVPRPDAPLKEEAYDADKGEIGVYDDSAPRVKIVQSINHDGEVNRARYMPQNPDLIATKTVMGEVYIFDRTKHPTQPKDENCSPNITLRGHSKEGYGLAWNPTSAKKGHILSASEDTTVCHWDINAYGKANSTLEPLTVYKGHSSVVEDVDWHATQPDVFASVGDDRRLLLWDTRAGSGSSPTPTATVEAHDGEVNCVAFSPHSATVLLTGSADKTVGLWDTRNLKTKLHVFQSHLDEVLQLAWSPHNEPVFASGGADRRVYVWDCSKIGLEQTPEDAQDGPSELMFIHGGHTSRLTDIAWSPSNPWHLASAAEDNVLQLWSPSAAIWAADDVPVDPIDLE